MDRFSSTLSGLAAPRRSVPIVLGAAALVGVQAIYSADPRALAIPIALVVGFVVLAPWSWRSIADRRLRVIAVVGAGAGVVALACAAIPAALDLGPTYLSDPGAMVIEVVLFAIGGVGLGRDLELELDVERNRLAAIDAHLDPHFLYNTLNAIAEWCAEDPAVAEQATLRLASMLRELERALALPAWPLASEQQLAEDLLELHRIRDTGAFTADVTVTDATGGVLVPPLVLVTLVENALKHGPRKGHRGAITVRATATATGTRLEVENPSAPPAAANGHGLPLLRRRLGLAYGRAARLAIDHAAGRTTVVVELPPGAPCG